MPRPIAPLSAALLLALALAACDRAPSPAQAPPETPSADAAAAVPDPDVPEALDAPPPMQAPDTPARPAMPAPGAIGWAGFGPAAFGANQEAVVQSWGRDLGDAQPSEPGGCYYLIAQPLGAAGYRLAFMIEGDRFSRIDVRAEDIEAPGGGRVGMDAAQIEALYPGLVERQPHKYVDGAHYLRIPAPDGGESVLLFETDAGGRVEEWRIGVPPQVDYVEGCG
ncbi:hypothetical protein LDO32_08255 [Luteimonas sp. Y-2-2-4F]|nr:hypothetical protein [Luteimonas sp. Y-2-2-4F]